MRTQNIIYKTELPPEDTSQHSDPKSNFLKSYHQAIISNLSTPDHRALFLDVISTIHQKIGFLAQKKQLKIEETEILLKMSQIDTSIAKIEGDKDEVKKLEKFIEDIKIEIKALMLLLKEFSQKDQERSRDFKKIKQMINDEQWDIEIINSHFQQIIELEALISETEPEDLVYDYTDIFRKKAREKNISFSSDFWEGISHKYTRKN
ncbi:MAG TPA: hypothetical protein PKD96_00375 [Candidatus Absconditabacterales bacterium]|nr:hypothetical protein [Candidatus Absconditabacterales bacterium]HMT26735.1 hypothetical protein [Candidatus Absconditabacterales bacterium]